MRPGTGGRGRDEILLAPPTKQGVELVYHSNTYTGHTYIPEEEEGLKLCGLKSQINIINNKGYTLLVKGAGPPEVQTPPLTPTLN